MKEPLFTGAATALVTPFLGDSINYPMLEQLLRRQIDAGIDAVVIAGTTGESATLSDGEKLELFRRAKDYVGNRCKIIAGTGSNSTRHTMELSMAAEQTGVDIPVSVYRRLSRIPNIAGVKESAPDITKYTKILAQCGSSMAIWAGNDDMATPVIALGGKGVISVLSNILPTETQALARAALDGDFDTAAALQIRLQPLVEALFAEVNPIPVKQAMQFIGYDCGGCRLPLTPLSDENREKLRALLLR